MLRRHTVADRRHGQGTEVEAALQSRTEVGRIYVEEGDGLAVVLQPDDSLNRADEPGHRATAWLSRRSSSRSESPAR